jgi:hypothetical protein
VSTHPVCASLDAPLLSFAEKRVENSFFKFPLSAAGEERDVERSDDRVSLPRDNLNCSSFILCKL